jgi:DNA-binding transcriptional MerR regulator
MAQFSIGEVEDITGVKAHILRYWEQVIPSIAPQKNLGGRRTYSMREVQLIMRLRYLIQEKKYTIEGARNCLIEEAVLTSELEQKGNNESSDAIIAINEVRSELISLYTCIHKRNNVAD